jgi:hypothetical protein
MQGFANGRGLTPVFGVGFDGADAAGQQPLSRVPAAGTGPVTEGGRSRLHSARSTLDGLGGLGWSVIGFVLGAVFWHFVGFWSFVSDVLLAGPPSAVQPLPRPAIVGSLQTAEAAVAPKVPCISLRLDRHGGPTSAAACEPGAGPLLTDSFEGREDRAEISSSADGWVAPHAPPHALNAVPR